MQPQEHDTHVDNGHVDTENHHSSNPATSGSHSGLSVKKIIAISAGCTMLTNLVDTGIAYSYRAEASEQSPVKVDHQGVSNHEADHTPIASLSPIAIDHTPNVQWSSQRQQSVEGPLLVSLIPTDGLLYASESKAPSQDEIDSQDEADSQDETDSPSKTDSQDEIDSQDGTDKENAADTSADASDSEADSEAENSEEPDAIADTTSDKDDGKSGPMADTAQDKDKTLDTSEERKNTPSIVTLIEIATGEDAIPQLKGLLESEGSEDPEKAVYPTVYQEAVLGLGEIARQDTQAIELLIDSLDHQEETVKATVRQVILQLGKPALETLNQKIYDKNLELNALPKGNSLPKDLESLKEMTTLAQELSTSGAKAGTPERANIFVLMQVLLAPDSAISKLTDIAEDPKQEASLRIAVIESLGKNGVQDAVQVLDELSESDPDRDVRNAAKLALQEFNDANRDQAQLLQELLEKVDQLETSISEKDVQRVQTLSKMIQEIQEKEKNG